MILADTFQTSTEQKLSFATLAYQAEYGGFAENERSGTDFLVEYYASNDLINQVKQKNIKYFVFSDFYSVRS